MGSCSCQSVQQPVSQATLNATIGATNTKLDALIEVLSGRLLAPVASSGSGAHTQYVGSADVWTLADVDLRLRVEVSPANNSDGSTKLTTLSLMVGPNANSDSEVNAATAYTPIPTGATGYHYSVAAECLVPKGYYFRVDATTSVSGGIDTTKTRVIRTLVKA